MIQIPEAIIATGQAMKIKRMSQNSAKIGFFMFGVWEE
jgi:hypothetical protein